MSLFDAFDPDSEEILKPSHMIRPVEGFPETVVLTFEEKSLQALQSGWNTRAAATLRGGRDIPVYALRHNGRELAVCQSIIGGAGTAGLLEEALALGAKKVLIYGSCGVALHPAHPGLPGRGRQLPLSAGERLCGHSHGGAAG